MKNYILPLLAFFFSLGLPAQPEMLPSGDYALFFAVEQYKNSNIEKVPNAIGDALYIAGVLGARYGFQVEVLENPTAQEIGEKLRECRERFSAGQHLWGGRQLLLYFIGRGALEGGEGYFLPADADTSRLAFSALAWHQWLKDISRFNCRNILVAADAEFSDAISPGWNALNRPALRYFPEEERRRPYRGSPLGYRSRIMLALGPGEERSEGHTSHSRLLEELFVNKAKGGSPVTMSSLQQHLFREPQRAVSVYGFEGDGGLSNFIFTPRAGKAGEASRDNENLWRLVQEQNSLEALSFYCRLYPDGQYVQEALLRMDTFSNTWMTADGREWQSRPPSGEAQDQLVLIKGGVFIPGIPGSAGRYGGVQAPRVYLRDFYLSPREVSFDEFQDFIFENRGILPEDMGWGWGSRPVINVDWYDAVEYCNWLSRKRGLQEVYKIDKKESDTNNFSLGDQKKWAVTADWWANGYRLPTAAEWEYAACGRDKYYEYVWEKERKPRGNIADQSAKTASPWLETTSYYNDGYPFTSPTGQFRQDALPLYDLAGNVNEWCWDWEDPAYYEGVREVYNPRGPEAGALRSFRGGAWDTSWDDLSCTSPWSGSPGRQRSNLGFRLARNVR